MAGARIHHLGCGTMCPRGRRLLQGEGGLLEPARIPCHVLLIESSNGLVLVDTGFGLGDVAQLSGLARAFGVAMQTRLSAGDTAYEQIRGLGLDPGDVRHVVLTHLDLDHSGGLPDFPRADVHVSTREHEARLHPPRSERPRYAMAGAHWAHDPRWVVHDPTGEDWFGFAGVRLVPGVDVEVVMIPLGGHTLGSVGIAVRPSGSDRWILHCGDAYFHRDEVAHPPSCPPGLRAFQRLVAADDRLRRDNQERLRELATSRAAEVELICSHDPVLLDRAAAGESLR